MPGLMNIVSEGELQQREQAVLNASLRKAQEDKQKITYENLGLHIRNTFEEFRRARDMTGTTGESLNNRIINALKAYNGQYTTQKLQEIKSFGGSEVYARLITTKCRGVTAMLRDIFLGNERPWGLSPTAWPTVPEDKGQEVDQLIQEELMNLQMMGLPPPTPSAIAERRRLLLTEAHRAAVQQAQESTQMAEDKLQDLLQEGGFYTALREFLIDFPIYPYAVLKGPLVKLTEDLRWENGEMTVKTVPGLFWTRVDPNDTYFALDATCVEDTPIIEKMRLTRGHLASLIGVPGYDEETIRTILRDYKEGLSDWLSWQDAEYAREKGHVDPQQNTGELIDTLAFYGNVPGSVLREYGFDGTEVPDPDVDYAIEAWQVGPHVFRAKITDNPRKRPPYYISAFEKVPGSLVGSGLNEVIADIAEIANATIRSLVNNMSLASGPQVALNESRLSPTTDADSMYPWKRWRFIDDPLGNQAPPINFFQPQSNAQELLQIFQQMTIQADEISAIPRYLTGSSNIGGAGRTASGLSMLMNNATKVLQNLAAQIDAEVMRPALQGLYDIVMLTDTTGLLKGDENIVVQGVSVAVQRDTDRMRQLEFLQMTMNPVDMQLLGPTGRATVLRKIADGLGLQGAKIVPSDKELRDRMEMERQAAAQAAALGLPPPGAPQPEMAAPGAAPKEGTGPSEQNDNRFRSRSPEAVQRQGGGV